MLVVVELTVSALGLDSVWPLQAAFAGCLTRFDFLPWRILHLATSYLIVLTLPDLEASKEFEHTGLNQLLAHSACHSKVGFLRDHSETGSGALLQPRPSATRLLAAVSAFISLHTGSMRLKRSGLIAPCL